MGAGDFGFGGPRAEPCQERVLLLLASLEVVEQSKAAGIIEANDSTVVEPQHHMVVRCVRQSGAAGRDSPGHAEMQQQKSVRIELDQDVLPAPAQRPKLCAVEPCGKGRRKRPTQIRPAQLGVQDAAAAHLECETAPDSLDLRQFGHRSSMPEEVQISGSWRGSNWRILSPPILHGYFPSPSASKTQPT